MLDIKNLAVTYGSGSDALPALKSLNLNIGQGEYAAILGPNGSGKSTLIKAICGLIPIRHGDIKVLEKTVFFGKFGAEMFGKIAVVFQEPAGQFLMSTVGREILSVLQNLGLTDREQKAALRQLADFFSLRELLPESPRSLSGGQMQLVNLACALALKPHLVLLDEPTTFLDTHFRNLLLEYIDSLHRSGLAVVHVTQYPDEALRADRVIILDAGEIIADGEPGSLLANDELLERHRLTMPRRLACLKWLGFDCGENNSARIDDSSIDSQHEISRIQKQVSKRPKSPYLFLRDVRFAYGTGEFSIWIDELSLYRGEITGLIGPAGSGKSTLAFLLAALLTPESGEFLIEDRPVSELGIDKIRRRTGLTWQIPEPAFIGPTVAEEIEIVTGDLSLADVQIERILSDTGLSGLNDRIVDTLSGGEKRRLSLAIALAGDPDYLILDEPSAFLDPAAQLDLRKTIERIAASGKGVLLIGHDIPLISELADRVIGLSEGRIVFDSPAENFFSEPAYLNKLGLPDDPLIGFRKRLAAMGVTVPFGSLDPKRLAEFLHGIQIR